MFFLLVLISYFLMFLISLLMPLLSGTFLINVLLKCDIGYIYIYIDYAPLYPLLLLALGMTGNLVAIYPDFLLALGILVWFCLLYPRLLLTLGILDVFAPLCPLSP